MSVRNENRVEVHPDNEIVSVYSGRMTKNLAIMVVAAAMLLSSCGIYARWPKKAEPDQTIIGEEATTFGKPRIREAKEMVSWRPPKGHHFENMGSCSFRPGDDGKKVRVCIWKVVEDEGDAGPE
jgi:hypothetical protein